MSYLQKLGSRLLDITRDPRAAILQFQHLIIVIQRENVRCVLSFLIDAKMLQEIPYLYRFIVFSNL